MKCKKKFIEPKLIKYEKPLDKVTLAFAVPYVNRGQGNGRGGKGKCPLFG